MLDIYPSLIAADLLNLEREIKALEPYCAGFHLDFMDGDFVPNIGFGPHIINQIGRITNRPLWVHLMADNPLFWFEKLEIPEKSTVSIHIESKTDISELIMSIQEKGQWISIAIGPKTNIDKIFTFLSPMINQVLIMSVEPGFYGQKFMPDAIDKIKPLVEFKEKEKLNFTIAMDGGIDANLASRLYTLGVTQIAVGSGIFGHRDRVEALKSF